MNFEDYVKPLDEKDFNLVGKMVIEPPNIDLYSFTGKLVIGSNQFALNVKQLLLKGSNLKNTEWVLGVVAYTGKDSKLMLNSQKSRTKQSYVEKKLNTIIFLILMVQLCICFILSMTTLIRDKLDDTNQDGYLGEGESDEDWYLTFFSYFLLLNTMIPISLIITVEIVKVLQCIWIMWDSKMYSIEAGTGCNVSSTTINEELGQIKYIFSDKTGTLTQNIMEFRALCVDKEVYGSIGDQIKRKASMAEQASEISHAFKSSKLSHLLNDPDNNEGDPVIIKSQNGKAELRLETNRDKLIEVIKLLAICHECMPEKVEVDGEKSIFYQGPSPDETTLVDFARTMGFEF